MRRWSSLPATLAAASACAVPGPGVTTPDVGAWTVAWTIGGDADPARCSELGAVRFHLEVFDAAGFWIAERAVPCAEFTVDVRLWPGTYRGEASLRGAADVPLAVARLEAFALAEGDEVRSALDFPARGGPDGPRGALDDGGPWLAARGVHQRRRR